MKTTSAWNNYSDSDIKCLTELTDAYRTFISSCKTERECCSAAVKEAESLGYRSLTEVISNKCSLSAGDKIYATQQGKAVILVQLGSAALADGLNILGAHIDSPRLDLKQNPLFESDDMVFADTHYYGGIKKYQWVTTPLALHGVVAKTDGTLVEICIGEDAADPVFCVTDLLPHLGAKQLEKKGGEVVEGESLDILIGNRAVIKKDTAAGDSTDDKAGDNASVQFILDILADKYDISESDFLSAEIEVVPAGAARDAGLDRSMVIGYGQDDRVCAFASLQAQLFYARNNTPLNRTSVCVLVDKEEIGSVGASGMESLFFENTIAEIMELAGEGGMLNVRRALANSCMLSSDVSAAVDPAYKDVFESKNSAYLGRGVVFNKYTGARGKSGSNDARAEYIARIRRTMDDAGVTYQTAELGRVDAGGGGTIAFIPARYGMDVIDCGVAVLSMHSPWEVTSKADIYEAYKCYKAFLKAM